MGTPEFALPSLDRLNKSSHQIVLVVCQPDRKKDRGLKIGFSPIKQYATQHQLELFQPPSLKQEEALDRLAKCQADFFVVVAFGKMLPNEILELPKIACVNAHPSLLPKFRGPSPMQFALLEGEKQTGTTTMLISEEMDAGDILLSAETSIEPDEKIDSLSNRLAVMSAELLLRTIDDFDKITPAAQDGARSTYTRMIEKNDRLLKFDEKAIRLHQRFRALTPDPGVYCLFRGKRLMIKDMRLNSPDSKQQTGFKPGEILSIEQDSITVQSNEGSLTILSVQPENKKAMSVRDFINGYKLTTKDVFSW